MEEGKKLSALRDAKRKAFVAWLASPPTNVTPSGEIAGFGFESVQDRKLANWVNEKQPATLNGENKLVPGRVGNAVQLTGDDSVALSVGNFKRSEPFSVSLWVNTPDAKDRAVVFHRSQAWTDAASRGYELLIEDGKLKWSLIHFWPGNAISIRAKTTLPLNEWTHVVVSNDGSSRAAGLKLYVNGQAVAVDVVKDKLTKDITGGGGDNISLGERMRDRGFKGGAIDEFRVFNRELTALETLAMSDEPAANALLAKGDSEVVRDYFLATDADFAKQVDALKAARVLAMKAADDMPEIMVMRELPDPKKAFTLFRGQYDQHRDEVGAGTPASLPPFPKDAPKNRLGLAQWLTAPEHPLTSRVLVNRFWQSIFGRGLVRTAEDFGSQGARPLYPEVLDWLALRFIQGDRKSTRLNSSHG